MSQKLEAQKHRPEVGAPTRTASPRRTGGRRALAALAGRRTARGPKASPRGRGSHKNSKPTPNRWARPRGDCRPQDCPRPKSIAPRSGLPQEQQAHAEPVGGAPSRRLQAAGLPEAQKHRPEVGPPTRTASPHRTGGRRALAATAGRRTARSPKASPRGRGSHKNSKPTPNRWEARPRGACRPQGLPGAGLSKPRSRRAGSSPGRCPGHSRRLEVLIPFH